MAQLKYSIETLNNANLITKADKLSIALVFPSWLTTCADLDSEDEDIDGGGDDEEEVRHVHQQEAGHDSVILVGLVDLVYIKNCPW